MYTDLLEHSRAPWVHTSLTAASGIHSGGVSTDRVWPTKPKIPTYLYFLKMFLNLCLRAQVWRAF